MALNSSIEWTQNTWNPVTGCTKTSDGCLNCYAERMANRLKAMGQERYKDGFNLAIHPEVLNEPFTWKKGQRVFVCSMSDLFHEKVPESFIRKIFRVIRLNPLLTFQVLTKRSHRALMISRKLKFPDNLWLGVTVESAKYISRIDDLREIDIQTRFISTEPLLTSLPKLNLDGIHWVIVGGESGPGARVIEKDWVVDIYKQCAKAKVPFFFKQWGGVHKKKNGRELNGKIYSEYPLVKRVALR